MSLLIVCVDRQICPKIVSHSAILWFFSLSLAGRVFLLLSVFSLMAFFLRVRFKAL